MSELLVTLRLLFRNVYKKNVLKNGLKKKKETWQGRKEKKVSKFKVGQ